VREGSGCQWVLAPWIGGRKGVQEVGGYGAEDNNDNNGNTQ
jgi:hypothetical protein